jgi:hypothetical protein
MAHACIKETAYSITPCPKIMAIRQELHLYSHHHLDLEKCAMPEQVFSCPTALLLKHMIPR